MRRSGLVVVLDFVVALYIYAVVVVDAVVDDFLVTPLLVYVKGGGFV